MGSESDLVVRMGNSTTIAQIPTSSSIFVKDKNTWCFDAANDSKETDSIAEIAKLKKLKSQRNQSHVSDEINHSTSGMSESDTSTEEQEEEEQPTVVDDDRPDGLIRDLASRLKFGKSEEVVEEGMDEGPRYVQNRKTNEKLEKFKFLLVNLEEDEEVLDPGEFGVMGDYTACHFEDYPYRVASNATSLSLMSRRPRFNLRKKELTRSFEELNIESSSAEHSNLSEGLGLRPTATTVKSMDNVLSSRVNMRCIKIVDGCLDLDQDIEGTIV